MSQIMPTSIALEGVGIESHTGAKGTSHAITRHDYHCGKFKDSHDWSKPC